MPPDSVDLQLIRALQADAKASLVKLGREVGMSAPSVMERIRKLEQAGVITGYSAIVDARRVGLDVTAFIGVSIDYPGRIDAFEQWVAEEPRVLECHHVTGGASLLLKVKCASTEGPRRPDRRHALEPRRGTHRDDGGAVHERGTRCASRVSRQRREGEAPRSLPAGGMMLP